MKKLILIVLFLVGNLFSAVDTTQSLVLQYSNSNAYHSDSLGIYNPYGVNEHDLVYHNGNYYHFYNVYHFTVPNPSNRTYLRVAPTIAALKDSAAIPIYTMGVGYGCVVPTCVVVNDSFFLLCGSVDSSKNMLFASTTPKTAWSRIDAVLPDSFGDCGFRLKPGVDTVILLVSGKNKPASAWITGPDAHVFVSNNVRGPYTQIGTIMDTSQTPNWQYAQVDCQIAFFKNRTYAMFMAYDNFRTGADYGDPSCCIVELDGNYKAKGKVQVTQYPNLYWHIDINGNNSVFDPVMLNNSPDGTVYYSMATMPNPGSWGYVTPSSDGLENNNYDRVYPIYIDSFTSMSNYTYDLDATILLSDSSGLIDHYDSTNICVYDSSFVRCSTFVKRQDNTLYLVWQGNSSKRYNLCIKDNFHTNSYPSNILSDVTFDTTIVDRVSGSSATTQTGILFENGLVGKSVKLSTSSDIDIPFSAFNGRPSLTVEVLTTLKDSLSSQAIFNQVDGLSQTQLYLSQDSLIFYVKTGNWVTYSFKKYGLRNIVGKKRQMHLVCTFGSGTTHVYVNGDSLAQSAGSMDVGISTFPTFTTTLSLGYPTIDGFRGNISLFRVYSDTKTKTWAKDRYTTLMGKYINIGAGSHQYMPNIDTVGISKAKLPGTFPTIDSAKVINYCNITIDSQTTDTLSASFQIPLVWRKEKYQLQLWYADTSSIFPIKVSESGTVYDGRIGNSNSVGN